MSVQENRKTVEKMWNALSAMDWKTLKSCLHEKVHYEDVPTEDPGAHGRENVVKRLRIAFDHLSDHAHALHHMAAEEDVVFLDHTEYWTFDTGEKVSHTFCTMHEMKDGLIVKWSDYWDVNGFVSQFPASFLAEMAKGSVDDFTD
jgi:ketosteroid isomerase-like protein